MKQSGDWLSALTVMGRILTLTPFIAGMVILLFHAVGVVVPDLEGSGYGGLRICRWVAAPLRSGYLDLCGDKEVPRGPEG